MGSLRAHNEIIKLVMNNVMQQEFINKSFINKFLLKDIMII